MGRFINTIMFLLSILFIGLIAFMGYGAFKHLDNKNNKVSDDESYESNLLSDASNTDDEATKELEDVDNWEDEDEDDYDEKDPYDRSESEADTDNDSVKSSEGKKSDEVADAKTDVATEAVEQKTAEKKEEIADVEDVNPEKLNLEKETVTDEKAAHIASELKAEATLNKDEAKENAEAATDEFTAKGGEAIPDSYETLSKPKIKYLVIAGSFTNENNAKNEVKRLKKLGYQAKTVNFIRSKFTSVCVEECATKNKAKRLVKKLKKKHSMSAYVHKKKK